MELYWLPAKVSINSAKVQQQIIVLIWHSVKVHDFTFETSDN